MFFVFGTVTTIYAIEANNVREINFPSESGDHWSHNGDVLTMPAEALRENSDGGLVRLVCFAYNNLERVSLFHEFPFFFSFSFAQVFCSGVNVKTSSYMCLVIFFIYWFQFTSWYVH